jgi:hypothetical protein
MLIVQPKGKMKDQMEYKLCKSEPNQKDRTQIPANPSFKSPNPNLRKSESQLERETWD